MQNEGSILDVLSGNKSVKVDIQFDLTSTIFLAAGLFVALAGAAIVGAFTFKKL